MQTGFVDRERAAGLMAAQGLDALVVVQPENFLYATGAGAGFAALWRRAGSSMALIAADPGLAPAAVVTDASLHAFRASSGIADVRTHPIWTELADLTGVLPSERPTVDIVREAAGVAGQEPDRKRPASYDLSLALGQLRDILTERNLLRSRLGIEFDFIPYNDLEAFRRALPEASLHDSSEVFRRLRMVKHPDEIEWLRQGAGLAEAGIRHTVANFREGMSVFELSLAYRTGVIEAARQRGLRQLESSWDLISCGPQPWGTGSSTATLQSGDQVKFDCGCTLRGYKADMGRTYVFKRGDAHKEAIHRALLTAFEAGLEQFRPGNRACDVFRAAQAAMHRQGYESYIRGHFGHSIGANVWHEEWPFLSEGETTMLQPNMVFAYETPYYVDGVGGFMIEDQVVVTETGHQVLTTLPREYLVVG